MPSNIASYIPKYFEASEISTKWLVDIATLFSKPKENKCVYIAYLDNLQIWRIATISYWESNGNQPWIPFNYNYASTVLLLGEDFYEAIAVGVVVPKRYLSKSRFHEKTLYVPCALFEDLSPEHANHSKIEKVTQEFFGTSECIRSVERIHFYGDSCHLWAVRHDDIRPYC